MASFTDHTEALTVGRTARALYLEQSTGDPVVGALTFADAAHRLADGLARLPDLAGGAHAAAVTAGAEGVSMPDRPGRWVLELDHNQGPLSGMAAAGGPPPLVPIELDPLTIADDDQYVARIKTQPNLPASVKDGLVNAFNG
jgi:hypothetical protein